MGATRCPLSGMPVWDPRMMTKEQKRAFERLCAMAVSQTTRDDRQAESCDSSHLKGLEPLAKLKKTAAKAGVDTDVIDDQKKGDVASTHP